MTATLVHLQHQTDPLAPRLLPTSATVLGLSQDTPSTGPTRPFGLTRTTSLTDHEALLSLDGLIYDPLRQINVTPDGIPAVVSRPQAMATTTQNTQHDHQWFTDKDNV